MHARLRLTKLGVMRLPKLFFLHGNVAIGYCAQDEVSGITNRPGIIGQSCSRCGQPFAPSKLLFAVATKDYQDNPFTIREWKAARFYLQNCFMFTVFGYCAPKTDVEAVGLLEEAWGDVEERQLEQTEIICRLGADHEVLRATWAPFIHTHHYEIFDSFFDSWLANHPRRTGEAYWSQYLEAQFITDNPVPKGLSILPSLSSGSAHCLPWRTLLTSPQRRRAVVNLDQVRSNGASRQRRRLQSVFRCEWGWYCGSGGRFGLSRASFSFDHVLLTRTSRPGYSSVSLRYHRLDCQFGLPKPPTNGRPTFGQPSLLGPTKRKSFTWTPPSKAPHAKCPSTAGMIRFSRFEIMTAQETASLVLNLISKVASCLQDADAVIQTKDGFVGEESVPKHIRATSTQHFTSICCTRAQERTFL